MKLYIIILRTMENSPEVRIIGATNDTKKARELYRQASREANEWMADMDEDSGNWAEVYGKTFDCVKNIEPGTKLYFAIETYWCESVDTEISLHDTIESAESWIDSRRRAILVDNPNLTPFDGEDEMHLCDEDGEDCYFSIETVTPV